MGRRPTGRRSGESAYFLSKDTFIQILEAHASQFPNLEWQKENSSTSFLDGLRFGATSNRQTTLDAMVRNVAQIGSGFATTGFREGIGHTFVGMMFNSNRLFAVDRQKQEGTVASEEEREYQSPNFDIWKDLALEMAWRITGGVKAVDLPFVNAAEFSNEARIKSWSFCDYVMRRDPNLLRQIDQLAAAQLAQKVRVPIQLETDFKKVSDGVSIEQLDREWEDFWTEATPVLAAIRNNTPPLDAVSPGVQKWLAALNEARAEYGKTPPVTWSSNMSTRCFEHAQYLLENKDADGIAAEHTQDIDAGGSHLGSMFAQQAVVQRGAKVGRADKIFEEWLQIPGYRDVLVSHFLRTVGIYEEKGVLVMNVAAGVGSPKTKDGGYGPYPSMGARGIPREVPVSLIGPELQQLLAENDREGQKVVGFPLTLHFGSGVGDQTSYTCTVRGREGIIEGALLFGDSKIRRSSALGLVTFYPFEPLPSGEITVRWSFKLRGETKTVDTRFTTK